MEKWTDHVLTCSISDIAVILSGIGQDRSGWTLYIHFPGQPVHIQGNSTAKVHVRQVPSVEILQTYLCSFYKPLMEGDSDMDANDGKWWLDGPSTVWIDLSNNDAEKVLKKVVWICEMAAAEWQTKTQFVLITTKSCQ